MMIAQQGTRRGASAIILTFLMVGGVVSSPAAESPDRVLTTVAAVRGLSTQEAEQQIPVKLRGVVTFYDEALFSRFLQDETAGIYLMELTNSPALSPGQLVEVTGTAGPGEYAPVVVPTSIRVVGTAAMPPAKPVALEELVSGRYDGQLVEFSGMVRAVYFEKATGYHVAEFGRGRERFSVYTKELPVAEPDQLVESVVKVRGVCATMFNRQRQLFGVRLLTPAADGLVIVKPAPANPFDQPAQKISSLLRFTPEGPLGGRVKVSGTVASCTPGSALFIQEDESGLYCQALQRDPMQPGDRVEVVGFPALGEYTPILEDAVYRKTGTGPQPEPSAVGVNAILTGIYDSRLVRLPARLLARVDRGLHQFLLLESGGYTFQALLPTTANVAGFAGLEPGSDVMATGICVIERGNQWEAGDQWRASSFKLLLRSPEDVRVVQDAPGVDLPDGTWIASGCGVLTLGTLGWVVVLRRRLHRQSQTLRKG